MVLELSIIIIFIFLVLFLKDIIRLFINFDKSFGFVYDFVNDHYVIKVQKLGMDFYINAYSQSSLKYGSTVYLKKVGFDTYIVYMYVTEENK